MSLASAFSGIVLECILWCFNLIKVARAVDYVVLYVTLQCGQLADGPEGVGPVHVSGNRRSQRI